MLYHLRITDDVPATLTLHTVPEPVQVWWDTQANRTNDAPAPPGTRTRTVWRCEVYHAELQEVVLWDMPSTVYNTLKLVAELEPGLRFKVVRAKSGGRYVYAVTSVEPYKPSQAQPQAPAPASASVPAPVPSALVSASVMPVAPDPAQLAQLVQVLRQLGITTP